MPARREGLDARELLIGEVSFGVSVQRSCVRGGRPFSRSIALLDARSYVILLQKNSLQELIRLE